MKLIDSCGWLAVVVDGPQAEVYREYLLNEEILVPTVVMYEVYKVAARDLSEDVASQLAVHMSTRQVVPLSDTIALLAADLALAHGLAMGDAIVYATAREREATVVTSDHHFSALPDVEYLPVGAP